MYAIRSYYAGLDASVALFTAGVGTIIFHIITKGKVPVFLASSFAYIAPIIGATKIYGLKGTLGGLVAAGFVKMCFSGLIKKFGMAIVHKFLPSRITSYNVCYTKLLRIFLH